MISFKEFLSSHEERLRAEQAAQDRANERWSAAVSSLLTQLAGWIEESDPHGLVKLNRERVGDFERYGSSKKPDSQERLRVSVGDRETVIRPVALDVLGPRWKPGEGTWAGQAIMNGEPHGYELYRFIHTDGREEWYLRSTRDYQMRVLDQPHFDAALLNLFS